MDRLTKLRGTINSVNVMNCLSSGQLMVFQFNIVTYWLLCLKINILKDSNINKYKIKVKFNLTLGRARKFIPPPWSRYKGRGGGGGVEVASSRCFSYVAVF